MPRKPILPTIDWKSVFESGQTYEDWLKDGDSPENRDQIEARRRELIFNRDVKEFLETLPQNVYVVAIAEDWCGDVARHVPVMQKMAESSDKVDIRYIGREQHPDVFVRFLTNGGEAVPKFIFLNKGFVECGNWGPMPEACRELVARGKACGDVAAGRAKMAELYDDETILKMDIDELVHQIDIAACTKP